MALALDNTSWSLWDHITDLQIAADVFYQYISELVELSFPYVEKTVDVDCHPWINEDIVKLINKRDKLKVDSDTSVETIIEMERLIKRKICLAKANLSSDLFKAMKTSPVGFFAMVKRLASFKTAVRKGDGGLVFGGFDLEQTNLQIMKYFKSLLNVHKPYEGIIGGSNDFAPLPLVDQFEVFQYLEEINAKSSSAPYELPSFIYRDFAMLLVEPITSLINRSLDQYIIPSQWSSSFLIPFPKESSTNSANQIRPIIISSPILKICEKIILKQIAKSSVANMDIMQFGGISGRSSAQYLALYVHRVLMHLEDKGTSVCSLFTDFTKAFDNVDHTILINKLSCFDIPKHFIHWITSFLSNRNLVLKNGSSHQDFSFTCSNGIPQGSVLGSFLFNVMINEMAVGFDDRLKFIDDLTVSVVTPNGCGVTPQLVLNDINAFSEEAKVPLNPKKCQYMIHSFAKKKMDFAILSIDGYRLQCNTVTKILGVFIQSNLKWDIQVDHMTKSANKRMFMLYKLRGIGVKKEVLKSCYVAFIRPILEYCSPVWHPALTIKQRQSIESIQKRALRVILGSLHVSYEQDLVLLGLQSLEIRRCRLSISFAKKFAISLPQLIPPTRFQLTGRVTRRANMISIPATHTKRASLSPLIWAFKNINSHFV